MLGWIEVENATAAALADRDDAARRSGRFVTTLRAVDASGAPDSKRRGQRLDVVAADARRYLSRLPDDLDSVAVLEVRESCMAAPAWDGPPTWFHGDLYSGNLLARDGGLVAVIDLEGSGAGDPASDLIAAWWLFDESSRDTFLEAIGPDDASLRRGSGWALYMCIAAIP